MANKDEVNIAPILEKFSITGLNGYKNIGISFGHAVKIVAAENGSGKTTLLDALYAILTKKFWRLSKLDFSSVVLKFRSSDTIEIHKSEFLKLHVDENSIIERFESYQPLMENGLDESDIMNAAEHFVSMTQSQFQRTDEFMSVYRNGPWSFDQTYQKFLESFEGTFYSSDLLSDVTEQIKAQLGDIKIMYLPTYRRIEAQIPEFRRSNRQRYMLDRRTGRRKLNDDWDTEHLIHFGLNDVQDRLASITTDIRQRTAAAYATISGRTLDHLLLTGEVDKSLGDELNIQNLGVVLARLGKSDARDRLGHLIESEEIDKDENRYLKSFLGQMLEIYRETQDQENAIENFVNLVDSYWDHNIEEKHLTYDKVGVEVKLENVFTGRQLNLNNLSSGEKQMISIFARLYLNPESKYIILIDEPELSLSIDWQRKFLPDIFKSPSCSQLVAITHSPFIFENELDRFAGALEISFDQPENL